jgi:hypothetical protein
VSRKAQRMGVSGATSTVCSPPLTWSVLMMGQSFAG